MARPRLATVWLGGCSGCHMSFLDLDEWLFVLAEKAEVVFTPVADFKKFPENVDVALVEGAVANEDNLEMIRHVRRNTRLLVSFGDCAVTGNVTAIRNQRGDAQAMLCRSYIELAEVRPGPPPDKLGAPPLLPEVLPLHQVVDVDYFLPGCPPSADRIRTFLDAILNGREPALAGPDLKFG